MKYNSLQITSRWKVAHIFESFITRKRAWHLWFLFSKGKLFYFPLYLFPFFTQTLLHYSSSFLLFFMVLTKEMEKFRCSLQSIRNSLPTHFMLQQQNSWRHTHINTYMRQLPLRRTQIHAVKTLASAEKVYITVIRQVITAITMTT